jgi:tetratricopeptide (TPR) repeat protein
MPAADAAPKHGRWRPFLLWVALVAVTAAAYYPAWNGGMLWDDDAHLTRESLRSIDGLRRIWFDIGATQQYYPVVHSAFWLLHRLLGDHTLGYHLVNIVLHATSALLFAVILRWLAVPGAVVAAFLFALHPVHVESVAWMTELKNTLSGVFYLAAAWLLLRYDQSRASKPYAGALVLFVLALLSKSVTATLPAAMLVIWWWQRGRLRWREDVLPLLPFFVIGIAAGLMTAWVERAHIGAEGAAFDLTLIERGLVAGRAIWFYLATLVWPANLIFIYPRWDVSQAVWWQYLYPAGAIALVATLWLLRSRSRAPLAAVLLFIGTLFPALGFFNVYPFLFSYVADHFQYLASLSIIALGGAALSIAIRSRPTLRVVAVGLAIVAGVLTWQQSRQYVDAATLYRTTLDANPNAWLAHVNLGWETLRSIPAATDGPEPESHRAPLEEAAARFRAALRIKPDIPEAHNNLGTALMRLGRLDEALPAYQRAVALSPDAAEVRYNIGLLLERMGRYEEAVTHLREAVRLNPAYVDAHVTLGNALQSLGRFDEAVAAYREAIRLAPGNPRAHLNLGTALGRMGLADEAAGALREALRLQPDSVDVRRNLGIALLRSGRTDEGLAMFREAVRVAPSVATYLDLGHAFEAVGRYDDAIAALTEALRLDPSAEDVRISLERVRKVRR